jgi:hypothetical protein
VSCTFKVKFQPCLSTFSVNRQPELEGKSGPYFYSLESSIDILKKRAQELIENINESRQKDHALMTNFRDSLKIKVKDSSQQEGRRPYVKGEGGPVPGHVMFQEPCEAICTVPHFSLTTVERLDPFHR